MANFDEDIKRITDEILSDGTVDQIIREKVTDGIEKAIASSFNYGKLEKAVKERVEQILVPFIENYDMSAYIVKLDTVLTEIVNKSNLVDNKQMLENFQYLMKEPQITEMKLTDLFKEYKKFVARNMDTYDRKVEWDESPVYEGRVEPFSLNLRRIVKEAGAHSNMPLLISRWMKRNSRRNSTEQYVSLSGMEIERMDGK